MIGDDHLRERLITAQNHVNARVDGRNETRPSPRLRLRSDRRGAEARYFATNSVSNFSSGTGSPPAFNAST